MDTLTLAGILRAGARGYFLLSSDPSKLLVALSVVRHGHIWAPRDAVALMVSWSGQIALARIALNNALLHQDISASWRGKSRMTGVG